MWKFYPSTFRLLCHITWRKLFCQLSGKKLISYPVFELGCHTYFWPNMFCSSKLGIGISLYKISKWCPNIKVVKVSILEQMKCDMIPNNLNNCFQSCTRIALQRQKQGGQLQRLLSLILCSMSIHQERSQISSYNQPFRSALMRSRPADLISNSFCQNKDLITKFDGLLMFLSLISGLTRWP